MAVCGGEGVATGMRLLRIPNTLHLEFLYASEAMLPELEKRPNVSVLTQPDAMQFDAAGTLLDPWPARREGASGAFVGSAPLNTQQ